MKEIWKDIEGYEGLYQISNLGRAKSLIKRYHNKVIILNPSYTDGYAHYGLSKNAKTIRYRAHRLVANAFLPKVIGNNIINHKNCIRDDNRIENLEWSTYKKNNKYKFDCGNYSFSDKTIQKLKENSPSRRKVIRVFDGKEFSSLKELSRVLNVSVGSICTCIKKHYNIKGFKYKYKEME